MQAFGMKVGWWAGLNAEALTNTYKTNGSEDLYNDLLLPMAELSLEQLKILLRQIGGLNYPYVPINHPVLEQKLVDYMHAFIANEFLGNKDITRNTKGKSLELCRAHVQKELRTQWNKLQEANAFMLRDVIPWQSAENFVDDVDIILRDFLIDEAPVEALELGEEKVTCIASI